MSLNDNSARIASLIAMTVLGLAALPRPADAFFCFSFQIGGGPRYSYWAQSNPFGPWYGPTVDYPGAGSSAFPGGYGSPWGGWGSPWRGLGSAPQLYNPYGYGLPGYMPTGWGSPWQSPWQTSPWAGGYPFGSAMSPPGIWPMGSWPATGGGW